MFKYDDIILQLDTLFDFDILLYNYIETRYTSIKYFFTLTFNLLD